MKSTKPSVALVACIHGDEIAGKYVFDELKKDPYIRDHIGFFIAHPRALAKRKRFLTQTSIGVSQESGEGTWRSVLLILSKGN